MPSVFAIAPYPKSIDLSEKARAVLHRLDTMVTRVADEVFASDIWHYLLDPDTPDAQVLSTLREVMLAVAWYQPHTTEAGFHMLGRLPKDSGKLLTSLLVHKADEAEHGLWARRDYLLLGGREDIVNGPMSPATVAVAGVWWWMARNENPLGYIGAEYLFEYLTAGIVPPLLEHLGPRKLGTDGLGFLIEHAEEDIAHTNLLRANVARAVDRFDGCEHAMYACFAYFNKVYPLPVWHESLGRVQR